MATADLDETEEISDPTVLDAIKRRRAMLAANGQQPPQAPQLGGRYAPLMAMLGMGAVNGQQAPAPAGAQPGDLMPPKPGLPQQATQPLAGPAPPTPQGDQQAAGASPALYQALLGQTGNIEKSADTGPMDQMMQKILQQGDADMGARSLSDRVGDIIDRYRGPGGRILYPEAARLHVGAAIAEHGHRTIQDLTDALTAMGGATGTRAGVKTAGARTLSDILQGQSAANAAAADSGTRRMLSQSQIDQANAANSPLMRLMSILSGAFGGDKGGFSPENVAGLHQFLRQMGRLVPGMFPNPGQGESGAAAGPSAETSAPANPAQSDDALQAYQDAYLHPEIQKFGIKPEHTANEILDKLTQSMTNPDAMLSDEGLENLQKITQFRAATDPGFKLGQQLFPAGPPTEKQKALFDLLTNPKGKKLSKKALADTAAEADRRVKEYWHKREKPGGGILGGFFSYGR